MKQPFVNRPLFTLKKSLPAVMLLGSLSLALAPAAKAQMTISFTDDGTDTTLTWSGSWVTFDGSNRSALTQTAINNVNFFAIDGPYSLSTHAGNQLSGPLPWSISGTVGTSSPGAAWGMSAEGGGIYAPESYVAGMSISGSAVFSNKTLTDFGFSGGYESGVLNVTDGSVVTWSAGSAVPEPNTFAGLAGLAAMGFAASRRRRREAPSLP